MPELFEQAPPASCHRFEAVPDDLYAVPLEDLARLYWLIALIRAFETAVLALKDENLVHGPAHTSIGQEAVAAAVAVSLKPSDLIASTHRAHGHFLSKAILYYAPPGYSPLRDAPTPSMREAVYRTLAEIMGLKDGWCGGRGGSMHLYDRASGNLGSNAIVGGGIPLATGAAWGERLQGRDTVVVSFFGDGAINQGCFHEAANMAALWRAPVIYLVENNLYAVGTPTRESSFVEDLALRAIGYGIESLIVDGMDPIALYLALQAIVPTLRRQPRPFLLEAKTYRHVHHAGSLPGSAFGYRTKEEEAFWKARDPLETFPQRLRVAGLLGEEALQALKESAAALVSEALARCTATIEGKRVIPAALWPDPRTAAEGLRGPDPQGVRYVEREEIALQPMTLVEGIAIAISRAMERDERVIVLGEEVANLRGGAYGATRAAIEKFRSRLFNTPISETGFCGIAGGAAAVGMRPIVEVMYPDFALMASDQLFNQIGKLRHMYGGKARFPLILRTRVGIGFGYGGQHSMDPCGYFAQFPGWRVVAPSNAFDYIGLFNTALQMEDPILFVEHGQLYNEPGEGPAEDFDYCVAYGKARLVRLGSHLTVLTYMTGVRLCLEAAERLEQEGIEAEVLDLRTVDYWGMDYAAIGESLRKTGAVLIVEQAPRSMGIGARLAEEIQSRWFDWLDAPVARLSALDVPPPVSRVLEAAVLPDLTRVEEAMRRVAQREH